jgi:hypothetical protein
VFSAFWYRTLVLKSCPAALGSYMIAAGIAMTSINRLVPVNSISNLKGETAAGTETGSHRALEKKRFGLTKCPDSWTKPSRLPVPSCASHRQHPTGHHGAGKAQSRRCEAILHTDLVNRNWIWQILPGLRVPPKSLRKWGLAERRSNSTNFPVLLISLQKKGKSIGP